MARKENPNSIELKSVDVHNEIINIPEEIIAEILSRLPVQSILKFRSVSKSWLSLLSTEYFIKTHLKVSPKDPSAYRVILDTYYGLKQCPVPSLLSEQQTSINYDILNIDDDSIDIKAPRAIWHATGSCNGLVCIYRNYDLYLWNPSIKISMRLPSLDATPVDGLGFDGVKDVAGLVYDESNDDYKVVAIFLSGELDYEDSYKVIVNIYSLKTDSWKRVNCEKFNGRIAGESIQFANGKFHWAAVTMVGSKHKWDIVSLDSEREVYATVDQPDNYGGSLFYIKFGVLGGCICVVHCDDDFRLALWVLKEYGVKGSWSKVFDFDDYYPVFVTPHGSPVSMLPNGEILLACMKYFLVFNPTNNSFRTIYINNREITRSDLYVESLVSPIANGRLQSRMKDGKGEMLVSNKFSCD